MGGDAVSSAVGQYMQKGEVDMVNVGLDVLGGRIGSSMSNNVKTKK